MARMSNRDIAWWNAQPEAQTCTECGAAGSKAYVQPQRAGGALCAACITAINTNRQAAHKATLAAMPRCEVRGCNRRGAYHVGNVAPRALICKAHLERAQAALQRSFAGNALALFESPIINREYALELAATRTR